MFNVVLKLFAMVPGSNNCKFIIVKWLIWNVMNHDFLIYFTSLNSIKLNYLDFYFWPQWRNRIRFTLPPKTNTRQNIWNNCFLRHWISGNECYWFMKYEKQMRWALWLLQLTAWRESPGRTAWSSSSLPEWNKWSWESGETEATKTHRTTKIQRNYTILKTCM